MATEIPATAVSCPMREPANLSISPAAATAHGPSDESQRNYVRFGVILRPRQATRLLRFGHRDELATSPEKPQRLRNTTGSGESTGTIRARGELKQANYGKARRN